MRRAVWTRWCQTLEGGRSGRVDRSTRLQTRSPPYCHPPSCYQTWHGGAVVALARIDHAGVVVLGYRRL